MIVAVSDGDRYEAVRLDRVDARLLAGVVSHFARWAGGEQRAPQGFRDLVTALLRVSEGLEGTDPPPSGRAGEDGPMYPFVLRYGEAAALLGVSERTLKRLISSGRLVTVDTGGGPRVRLADLHSYTAALPPLEPTVRVEAGS